MKGGFRMNIEEFGTYLKELRENKNLTLTELGELIEYSNPYLSQIENGKRNNMPSPAILKKLSDVLNVSYFDLMVKAGHWEPVNPDSVIKKRDQEHTNIRMNKLAIESYFRDLLLIQKKIDKLNKKITQSDDDIEKNKLLDELSELESDFRNADNIIKDFIDKTNMSILEINELNEILDSAIDFEGERKVQDFLNEAFKTPNEKIDLNNILKMDEIIYLNEKALSPREKEKALSILKLVFEDEKE